MIYFDVGKDGAKSCYINILVHDSIYRRHGVLKKVFSAYFVISAYFLLKLARSFDFSSRVH